MKAKLKVNYSELKKGDVIEIIELHNKFVTSLYLGRKIDFGYSEIEFLNEEKTLFEIGRKLSQIQKNGFVMREKDIKECTKNIISGLKHSFKIKCYNFFIYG